MTVQQNVAFTVRMPPRTKSKLRRMAKARGVSQSQFLCSLIEGRTAEAAPPKAFWDAMHELYRIHDGLLHDGRAEDACRLELSIVALQSAFTMEPEEVR